MAWDCDETVRRRHASALPNVIVVGELSRTRRCLSLRWYGGQSDHQDKNQLRHPWRIEKCKVAMGGCYKEIGMMVLEAEIAAPIEMVGLGIQSVWGTRER